MFRTLEFRRGSLSALSLVILTAACGGDRTEESSTPEPDPYISTESPREELTDADYGELEPTEIGLNLNWTRNKVSKAPDPDGEAAQLTAVRTQRSRGYDRVVFSFAPKIPGYRLMLTTEGGGGCDGSEAATDAPVHLAIEFERAQASDDDGPLVRDRDRAMDFPALVTAAQSCDEGDKVRWLLGASAEVDYRIMEMLGEPRLVVDLRHPS